MNTEDGKAPWDIKEVKFLDKGEWFMVIVGSEKLFVKIPEDQAANMFKGLPVPAHHIMTANLNKPLYLSIMTATVEPWLLVGSQCSVIAKVHPVQAQLMDEEMKRQIAGVEKAKLVVPDKRILRVE